MRKEIVDENTIKNYMELLTNWEIFGIYNESVTCFGAFDDKKSRPMGVLIAEVFFHYIWIEKLFTLPLYRKNGVATELLNWATDIPDEHTMPFYIYGTGDFIDEVFLLNKGFTKEFSNYFCMSGTLGDLLDVHPPKNIGSYDMRTIKHVDFNKISDFVFHSDYDNFLQFPEEELILDRFSDGSIVCLNCGNIEAMVLLEEFDTFVQVTYIRGNDNKALMYCFSMLKRVLLSEYTPKMQLKFLSYDENGKNAIKSLLTNCDEKPISVFKGDFRKEK